MDAQQTVVTKETKNKIRVDFAGKLSFKDRLKNRLKSSNTWISVVINIFRFILMLGVSYVILYPFFSKIAGSFMSKADVIDATVSLIPKHFTLDIYKYIILENHYFEALLNTTLLSLLCGLVQMLVACLVGYGLAKFKFKGNKLVMILVIVTMIIPHSAMKLSLMKHFATFDLLRILAFDYKGIIELITGSTLQLANPYWMLGILSACGLAFKNGLYIYLMRQFFKGVPDELEESAYVDGASTLRTFFQIIIPLSIPMMITIFLFSFSWQWTDEFYTTLYSQGIKESGFLMPDIYKTIPESLQTTYAGTAVYEIAIRNTAGIMIIMPLVIVYLFCQRYLVQGIERSGLVG